MSLLQEAEAQAAAKKQAEAEKAYEKAEGQRDRMYHMVNETFPYIGILRETAKGSSDTISFADADGLRFTFVAFTHGDFRYIYRMQVMVDCREGNTCVSEGAKPTLVGATVDMDTETREAQEAGVAYDRDKFVEKLSKTISRPRERCSACKTARLRNRCSFCGRG